MNNNTVQAAPIATKAKSSPAAARDDARSVMSDTSTLAEDKKTASSSPKGGKPASLSKDGQLDSASAFAKEAAKKGWAAPTATRPTFG